MDRLLLWILLLHFWNSPSAGSNCREEISQVSFSCSDGNLSALPVDLPETIKSLDLSFNPLRHLHTKYFSHLYHLRYLDLTRCSITIIDDLAFSGLDSLHTLVLTGNPIDHWAPLSLFGLQSLKRLVVVETSLTSLFALRLENLTSLQELNAGSNLLTTLYLPASLISLHTLDLHANQIAVINESTLESLRGANTSKLSLILSRNSIIYLTPGTFSGITLNRLHMQGCFVNTETLKISLKALSGLTVRKLEIGSYRATKIRLIFQKGLLEGLCEMDVQELTINGMQFPIEPDTLCTCIKDMVSLRLVNTDLEEFSVDSGSTRLQHLELKNTLITSVPSRVFSKFPSLRLLRITNSPNLASFNTYLPELKKLELLDLSNNQLMMETCCSRILRNVPVLKHLNLSNNARIGLRSVFLDLPQLQTLDLSHSNLDTVGQFPLFMLLGNLTFLDLSYTYCHFVIHCSFCGLNKLEKLSVSRTTFDNDILAFVFQNLTQLRSLDLSACSLVHIPTGTFLNLDYLQELDLSKNKLMEIHPSVIISLSALAYLDLSSNQIPGMPKDTTKVLHPSLRKLDLSQNPFDCSCSQQNFLLWVQEHKDNFLQRKDHMLCNTPENIKGMRLIDVFSSNCLTPVLVIAAVLCIIFVGIMIFILHRCYLQKYMPLLRHLCCKKFYPQQVQQEEYDAFVIYSSGDEQWVRDQLVPQLEQVDPFYRLCVHYRDFIAGVPITRNIVNEGLLRSRKALVVLSPNFMQSQWCNFEFEMAKSWQLFENHAGLIIILLSPVRKEELRQVIGIYKHIRRNTYLEFGDERVFWSRLRKALGQGHTRTTLNT